MQKKLKSKGVLLTLGITFIALVLLSFATLILRNAENSDHRLAELGATDRVYTLTSSLEHSLSRSYYPLTGINVSFKGDEITIIKNATRTGTPDYFAPPTKTDPVIINMKISDVFLDMLVKSLTYNTASVNNPYGYALLQHLVLLFHYPTFNYDFRESYLLYTYTDSFVNFTNNANNGGYNFNHQPLIDGQPYCCFEINGPTTSIYPAPSTVQMFLIGKGLPHLKKIDITATHPTRCAYINWSADPWPGPGSPAHGSGTRRYTSSAVPGAVTIPISITVKSLKDSCEGDPAYLQTENNAILNQAGSIITSQLIYLDNLTSGFLYDDNPPANPSVERPIILFYDDTQNNVIPQASNTMLLAQYDNPLVWEVKFTYDVGPMEVYSTETLTADLNPLSISKTQRYARFK